ncbi:Ser/Thr protein kinase RdoA (MazF antagonist) [Stella humosa]|uniref:Ser/Thr protein kinase RdoA (MazF antagonist) n=1 Tax=Stella humosa TaxID=94 RepID=A0A3N1KRZ2_9PROT|nr:phosphotransferase [Stella humosa]ROP81160.1 Ser/Thr protein kinase RdoA (MazF antagonist) [Stella humosa]BBK32506.1 aminoglycoside phosphotransferase [Stella humosa]
MTTAEELAYAPAARQALVAFGLPDAELAFVQLAENVTFRAVDRRDGSRFVLRLHRPSYHDLPALKSEHVWTRALVQAGVMAPEPLLTPGGDSFVQVDVAAMGERRWAGLAHWVEGELLGDVIARETDKAASAWHFARLGAIMAAVHNQATGWVPPAGFRRHALDADGLLGPDPFWGRFWDSGILSPAERRLLLATRDIVHAALVRYGKPASVFSLIHADLHARNVLVDGAKAAVIDFDDSAFGWHQYDLAAALVSYAHQPEFALFRDACLEGYRSVRAIGEADLALLPMFVMIRGMALIGWYHQRPELPFPTRMTALKDYVCDRAAVLELPC